LRVVTLIRLFSGLKRPSKIRGDNNAGFIKTIATMKNLFKIFFTAIIIASLGGCAIHMGIMNNSAALGGSNFKYTQQSISGHAEATYVFAIGGLNHEALVDEAKQNMLKDHPLQPNQALANVTVNWKNAFYLVVIKSKCTVTADIVEFE
jgi:hypothetical protein